MRKNLLTFILLALIAIAAWFAFRANFPHNSSSLPDNPEAPLAETDALTRNAIAPTRAAVTKKKSAESNAPAPPARPASKAEANPKEFGEAPGKALRENFPSIVALAGAMRVSDLRTELKDFVDFRGFGKVGTDMASTLTFPARGEFVLEDGNIIMVDAALYAGTDGREDFAKNACIRIRPSRKGPDRMAYVGDKGVGLRRHKSAPDYFLFAAPPWYLQYFVSWHNDEEVQVFANLYHQEKNGAITFVGPLPFHSEGESELDSLCPERD